MLYEAATTLRSLQEIIFEMKSDLLWQEFRIKHKENLIKFILTNGTGRIYDKN